MKNVGNPEANGKWPKKGRVVEKNLIKGGKMGEKGNF